MKTLLALTASLVSLVGPLVAQDSRPIPADTEIVTTASGLKYSVLRPGDGKTKAAVGDVVKMHYTGWLVDGKEFDSSVSRGEPLYVEAGRGRVIKGWDEAIALMTKGQKLKLTIPPELAYGPNGRPPVIPAAATLIFEVEFVDVAWSFQPLAADQKKTTPSGTAFQVLRPGTGKAPQASDFVRYRFAAWKPGGELLRWSEMEAMRRGQPPSQNPGACVSEAESPFLREALTLTPVGGATRLEAPATTCFPTRLPPGVSGDTPITWQIEVFEIVEIPSFSMPDEANTKTTASGLRYEVVREGTGRTPKASDRVNVHYIGWLTNGTSFDSSYSRGEPATFGVGQVIKGWTEGLQLMKEGAAYKFVIPAELGYGDRGAPPDIAPGATLVFYVELLSIAG